jgi:hypothetical protein
MSSVNPIKANRCSSFFPYFAGIIGGCIGAGIFGTQSTLMVSACVALSGTVARKIFDSWHQKKEVCELKWFFDQREIQLLRGDNYLRYIVLGNKNESPVRGHIPTDNRSLEETVKHLSRCDVKVNGDQITFSISPRHLTWSVYSLSPVKSGCSKEELSLIQDDQDNLLWRLYHQHYKTISYNTFSQDAVYESYDWTVPQNTRLRLKKELDQATSEEFLEKKETSDFYIRFESERKIIGEIVKKYIPVNVRIDFLKNIKKNNIWVTLDPEHSRLLGIDFKQKTAVTAFSSSVSWDKWAVTLIDTGIAQSDNPFTWGGHAGLVIEGLHKGDYFIYFAHFLAKNGGSVLLHDEKHHPFTQYEIIKKCERKSETWIKAHFQVKEMLDCIRAERDRTVQIPKFQIVGKESIFARSHAHNCITWAIEKLKILDIELPNDPNSWLVTYPKNFTKPLDKSKYLWVDLSTEELMELSEDLSPKG